jgi:membrane-anchored mycosin MYCP
VFGRLARGAASAGLAAALCLGMACLGTVCLGTASLAAPALAGTKPSSHHSTKNKKKPPAPPPPLRPGPLPSPVQACLDEHGSTVPSGTPWAQQTLDYQSVWPFTEGSGVTVAVIDSGVDANPQYNGRVIVGPTLVDAPGGAKNGDCVGHGTSVAGIIAAAPMSGVPFAGVAPEATILSIKVTNSDGDVLLSNVVTGIVDAVQDGANVINLSLTEPNTPALSAAIQYAFSHNVVVVASAGNDAPGTGSGPFYPAAYPGVLSVGAVDSSGDLADFSSTRTPVSVTAPGVNITSTFPGDYPDAYLGGQPGTSFATAFVSGVAALVRARYPGFSQAQVVQRIEETADGAAGPGTGNGLVNPVQAITAVLPTKLTTAKTAATRGRVSIDRAAADSGERDRALTVTGGAFGVIVLVIAAAVVIPAGRRRRWRPGGDH